MQSNDFIDCEDAVFDNLYLSYQKQLHLTFHNVRCLTFYIFIM